MTDIPGTGSPKKITPVTPTIPVTPPAISSSVNSSGTQNTNELPEIWYNKVYVWMGVGTVVGIMCAILGIFVSPFLYLAPMGPLVGTLAWYARKAMSKSSSIS
jgi:hypothetical protein